MPMLQKACEKYQPFLGPDLPDRLWPSNTIKKAPRWLSTDLRDGNQSLASPMTVAQKWKYFRMLVKLGFKEIEISFPSASDTEFEFTRQVVNAWDEVPDDVWLQVLCPCRLDLIDRTIQSVKGAKKVILNLYCASSTLFLDTMLELSQQEVYEKVVESVSYAKSLTKDDPSQQNTTWNLVFSPEAFSDTELAYSLRLCEAAKSIWQPSIDMPIMYNLPATVEMSTPNVYADQVEIFSRSISEREKVCVSLHTHNDRGCAVAAAELGQMAGADRVEGVLFGNGERTGNVDLVTLALNLYSQGVDPSLDFSDLPSIRALVEECTHIKVHPRAPYAGDLVFMAYSGGHQDGINKGVAKMKARSCGGQQQLWRVPYLAIDPHDIGSNYEAVIRLNSQSGKGGIAWTLSRELQVQLPKGLQLQFSKVVKRASEAAGGVLSPAAITDLFLERYYISGPDPRILSANVGQSKQSLLGNGVSNGETGYHKTNGTDGVAQGENGHEENGYKSSGHKTNGTTGNHLTDLPNGSTSTHKTVDLLISINGSEVRLRSKGTTILNALENALSSSSLADVSFDSERCALQNASDPKTSAELVVVECRLKAGKQSSTSTWGARILQKEEDTPELLAALSAVLDLLEQEL